MHLRNDGLLACAAFSRRDLVVLLFPLMTLMADGVRVRIGVGKGIPLCKTLKARKERL